MRYAENLAEVARRGGSISSRSRLLLVACEHCRQPYLYDEAHDRLYLDATDLTAVWSETDREAQPPCGGCGASTWMFEDVPPPDDDADAGPWAPWSWCYWSPTPVGPPSPLRRAAVGLGLGTILVLGVAALVANPDPFGSPQRHKADLRD